MILDVFDKNFVRIENIAFYSYVEYTRELNSAGSFEIQISLDDVALRIRQSGKFILFETDVLGIISYMNPTVDEDSGEKILTIKGTLANGILSQRCIIRTMTLSGTRTAVVRNIVNTHCVSPEDPKRSLPIVLSTNPEYIPTSAQIDTQKTGGSVEANIEEILDEGEMGYDVVPILSQSTITGLEFRVISGKDRTVGNSENNVVLFSEDLRNILKSDFTYNASAYKNMAYAAGEDSGTARVVVEAGETSSTGLDRFELYIDARDVQSTTEDEQQLTPEQYAALLTERATSRLAETKIEQSYTAQIYQLNCQYVFGQDYKLGDLVTVYDPYIDLALNTRVTAVRFTSMGEQNLIDVTFGYYKMSTSKKLKRRGVI